MTDATTSSLLRARWDAEYRDGHYAGELPIAFVERIVESLSARPAVAAGRGLDVGCGNGRNFLPLVDAGLDLDGLDLSAQALGQLARRRPDVGARLVCEDFQRWRPQHRYAYVIAIQVFQHGTAVDAVAWFRGAATLLSPGGLLFLRVNSVATEIYHRHTVLERTAAGGITIRYDEGPKRGLPVHFYSQAELLALTRNDFIPVGEPSQDVIRREPPKTGSWAQWGAIWQRR